MSRKTRKQRAEELWQRLERGPSIGLTEAPLPPAEFSARYRGWSRSWILAEVAALVPELRDKVDVLGNIKGDK